MRVILFDMMDTLIRDPYHSVLDRLLPESHTREEYISWRERPAFEEFERGEITETEYFQRFYKSNLPDHLRETYPRPEKLKKELLRTVSFLPGLEEIIGWLSGLEGLRLGLASNYSFWYQEIFRKKKTIPDSFQFYFFSCEMGVRKPETGYYDTIEESLKKAVGEIDSILFIDDREVNLAPARNRGWKVHRMTDSASLRPALEEFLKS